MLKDIDKIGLSNELIDKIEQYLGIRIGHSIIFVESDVKENEYAYLDTDWIEATKENCGVFSFIIKKYFVRLKIYVKEDNKFSARVSMRYEHPDGGSNGHDMYIWLKGDLEDEDFIEY